MKSHLIKRFASSSLSVKFSLAYISKGPSVPNKTSTEMDIISGDSEEFLGIMFVFTVTFKILVTSTIGF